jgi:hypothetical protein
LGSVAALSLAAGVLTACGSSGGVPTLTWYINPDNGGQAAVDQEVLAGCPGRLVAGEVQRQVGDIVGRRDVAQGHTREQLFESGNHRECVAFAL